MPLLLPRIERVTLRAGTRYRVIGNGDVSAYQVLEADTEVKVQALALRLGEQGVYRVDGQVIVVEYRDEVRGRRVPGR